MYLLIYILITLVYVYCNVFTLLTVIWSLCVGFGLKTPRQACALTGSGPAILICGKVKRGVVTFKKSCYKARDQLRNTNSKNWWFFHHFSSLRCVSSTALLHPSLISLACCDSSNFAGEFTQLWFFKLCQFILLWFFKLCQFTQLWFFKLSVHSAVILWPISSAENSRRTWNVPWCPSCVWALVSILRLSQLSQHLSFL